MSENRTSSSCRERRKRKWDVPGSEESTASASVSSSAAVTPAPVVPSLLPLVGALPGVFPSAAAAAVEPVVAAAVVQQSAVAIVQKINQGLAARGVLPPLKAQDEVVAKEIVINDAEPGVRYKLTKRQTQEDIQSKTGAVVITRGRYKAPGTAADPGGEKPLYLHISAGVHLKDTKDKVKAVDQAVAIVEEMLKIGRFAPPSAVAASAAAAGGAGQAGSGLGGSTTGGQGQTNPLYGQAPLFYHHSTAGSSAVTSGGGSTPLTAVVYAGFEADRSFNLGGRVRGPDDRFIDHIAKETGAAVVLRGMGSGERDPITGQEMLEPLHLHITCSSQKALDEARWLAENLMDTIRNEYYRTNAVTAPNQSMIENPNHRGTTSRVSQQLRMGTTENHSSSSGYGASGMPVYGTAIPAYHQVYPGAGVGGAAGGGFPLGLSPGVLHSAPLAAGSGMGRSSSNTVAMDWGPIRGPNVSVTTTAAVATGTKRYSAVPPPPQLLAEQKALGEDSERVNQAAASASRSGSESSAIASASSLTKAAGRGTESSSLANTSSSSSSSSSSLSSSSSGFGSISTLSSSLSSLSKLSAAAAAALFVGAASSSGLSAQPHCMISTSYAAQSPASSSAAAPSPYSYAGYAVRPLMGTAPGPFPFCQPNTTLSTHSLPASFGAAFLPGPPPLSGSQAWAYQHPSSGGSSSAQTLQRPPPPVSVNYKTTSASSSGVAGSSSSHGPGGSARGSDGKHSDSAHPPQKRRFQEFPKEQIPKAAESNKEKDDHTGRHRQDATVAGLCSAGSASANSAADHVSSAQDQARLLSTTGPGGGVPMMMSKDAVDVAPPPGAHASLWGSSKTGAITTSSPPRPAAQGAAEYGARNWHAVQGLPSSFSKSTMNPPSFTVNPAFSHSPSNIPPLPSAVASHHSMGLALSAGSRSGASGSEEKLKLVDYGEEEEDDTGGLFSSSGKGASPLPRLNGSAATAYGKRYGAA
ncbi:hypothetical protein CBR_g19543 [Chara braunii]|uniref:Protein RIK n=1 Tax=Chara braunii TaxID=69332 RepID=A0A388KY95_CHABU|nr:hypothetical protein CBR_g19543 [Chara braunii]|eukprot:GBG75029.1 hypothetical protein CBR_g19543 [Chara braunii]